MRGKDEITEKKYQLYPNEGVGEFRLGDPIAPLLSSGKVVHAPWSDDPLAERPVETRDGAVDIYPDPEYRIESFLCDKTLVYNGHELIGLSGAEVTSIFGDPSEVCDTYELPRGDMLTPWNYDDLGLSFSFVGDRVANVIVDIFPGEDD